MRNPYLNFISSVTKFNKILFHTYIYRLLIQLRTSEFIHVCLSWKKYFFRIFIIFLNITSLIFLRNISKINFRNFKRKKKFQSPDTMINYSKINEESAPDNYQNNFFVEYCIEENFKTGRNTVIL